MDFKKIGITAKHASADPGKTFVWALMDDLLSRRRGSVGVDASCDYFKSYKYFRTRRYIGVDNNRETLKRGLALEPAGEPLLADLATLRLPEDSVDVLLSTHTLQYFKPEQVISICAMFSKAIKSDGLMILHVPNAEYVTQLHAVLRTRFNEVRRLHVGHWFTRRFVDLFTRNGVFGHTPLFNSKPVFFLSRLLARTEAWLAEKSDGRKHQRVIFVCRDKKEKNRPKPFVLPKSARADDGVYEFDRMDGWYGE